jgi:acyl transferase domain-containing protein
MARACLPDLSTTWLDTLRPGRADWAGLMGALRSLYLSGSPMDWGAVHEGSPARRIGLPTYPFQGHRHWPDSSRESASGIARTSVGQATGHPLLGRKLPQMAHAPATHIWEASLGDTELAYLHDHQIGGRAVMPYAAYLEMAVTGARLAFAWQAPLVSGLKLRRPLFLDTGGITRIQAVLTEEHPGAADFRVYGAGQASSTAEQRWTIFAEARLRSVAALPRKGGRDDQAWTDVLR